MDQNFELKSHDNNESWVLIYEKNKPVKVVEKENNKYLLEGIVAEFDVKNSNGRIYREEDYLPHLEYLKEKIKNKVLVGELDHPVDRFDVDLKNVSHIIEDLYYVPEQKVVKAKVRLLNTQAGKIAQALIDGGVVLSISSRSAGVVESNGEVKLKKIFTYDLVAEPGFENAKLYKVNEKFGVKLDSEDVILVEAKDNSKLKEYCEYGGCNYYYNTDTTVRESDLTDSNIDVKLITENVMMSVDEKIDKLISINKLQNSAYMEVIEKLINLVNERYNDLNKDKFEILYSLNKLKRNFKYKLEEMNRKDDLYLEAFEYIEKNLMSNIKKLNEKILDLEVKHKNLDKFLNGIEENLNKIKSRLSKFSSKYDEDLRYVEERLVSIEEKKKAILDEIDSKKKKEKKKPVTEEINSRKKKYIDINELVKLVDESLVINSEDIEHENKEFTKYYRMLSENNRRIFNTLSDNLKEKIIDNVLKKSPKTEEEILKIWEESTFVKDIYIDGIEYLPEKYKKLWDSLPYDKKRIIFEKLKLEDPKSMAELEMFFENLDEYQNLKAEKLIENVNLDVIGVDKDYITNFIKKVNQ